MKTFSPCLACFILVLSISIGACKQKTPIVGQVPLIDVSESIPKVQADSFDLKVNALMEEYTVPGSSMAFIKEGVLHSTRSYGILQKGETDKVDAETMFSVGSVSKVVNAILILKLVDEGMLSLNEDVNQYLEEWKVESSQYTQDNPVTLKAILSHTAGFSVHGFADYLPEEEIPTTIQILNGTGPAKNQKVEIIHKVGSKWKYSGGGITVSQKIVEDVTGYAYHEAAHIFLFEPLGLNRTTYENPLPSSWKNIAKAHDGNGAKVALPRGYQAMPEAAASGLWTTPSDLAKILISFYESKSEIGNKHFISSDLCDEALTKVIADDYGLSIGLSEYKGSKLMQHAGSNDSYKAYFLFFYEKGTGYLSFTNGSNGMDFIMDPIDYFTEYSVKLN